MWLLVVGGHKTMVIMYYILGTPFAKTVQYADRTVRLLVDGEHKTPHGRQFFPIFRVGHDKP